MESHCSDLCPKIGEVYLMNFEGQDNAQKGVRPGIVFQNNLGNSHSPNLIVLPLTTAIKKMTLPTHVFIPKEGTGLLRNSVALCENPCIISKQKIGKFLTKLPDEYMAKIAVASLLATSAISFVNPENLIKIWEKAKLLNSKTA